MHEYVVPIIFMMLGVFLIVISAFAKPVPKRCQPTLSEILLGIRISMFFIVGLTFAAVGSYPGALACLAALAYQFWHHRKSAKDKKEEESDQASDFSSASTKRLRVLILALGLVLIAVSVMILAKKVSK